MNLSDDEDNDPESADEASEAEELTRGRLCQPCQPTQAEVDAHERAYHLPYRSWCSSCVRGRGKAQPHKRIPADEKAAERIPTISYDYGFFTKKVESGAVCQSTVGAGHEATLQTLPILIVKDRRSKAVWAHPVPCKGTEHPYPAKAALRDLEMTGYKRVIGKSDQEASILKLINEIKHGWKGELIPEAAPKGDAHAQSNGEVERAVQEVLGLARTLKDALEQKSGIELDPKSPLLAWLVELAANVLTLLHKGAPKDGFTAYMRLKGKPWKIELPMFGETVEEDCQQVWEQKAARCLCRSKD